MDRNPSASVRIDRLIDQVLELTENPGEARRRHPNGPSIGVGIEEPIAWTVLFGFDANRYFADPWFYMEQTLKHKLWRWQHVRDDALMTPDISAWLGHYPEYTLLGMSVDFTPKGIPILQQDHPISRQADMRLLSPISFTESGWMPRALRWHEDLTRIAAGRLKVGFVTWARGCLDLAIQLRGYTNFVGDTVERPGFIHDLLGFLTEQRLIWHDAFCAHFGQRLRPAYIADDWLNVPFISPGMFVDFVLPRYLEIEAHHGGIGGIHSCGNQTPLQCHMLELKSLRGFEVSPWTDLEQTLVNIPSAMGLGLSLHPNDVLLATEQEMRAKLLSIGSRCEGRRWGLGTSGLTPIFADNAEYAQRIDSWLAIAREVLQKP